MNLKLKTFESIRYTSLSRIIQVCLSTITNIVLARHLVSEDYGIVSFSAIFTNFIGQFSDFGLTSAVIRKHEMTDDDLNVGYTLTLFLSFIMFAVAVVFAPISQCFIDNVKVVAVIRVSSLGFIISTFSFIPSILLTRELNFKKLIIPQIGSALLTCFVSVTMAITGYKYWSLVFGSLAGLIAFIILINIIKPVRIKIKISRDTAYDYLKFGGNLFLTGLIVYIVFNADNFVIGTLSSATMLGFYAVAFNWGSMIPSILYSTVHNVLFPAFSKIQKKEDSIIGAYLQVMRYVSFVAVLSNVSLFLVADEFLFFILGRHTAKWMPAVPALKILCIYGIIRAILEPIGNVLLAEGQTRLSLRSNLIVSIVQLLFLYPTMRYFGIEGVAILVSLSYTLQYFIYFPYIKKRYDLSFGVVWDSIRPAIVAGIIVAIVVSVCELYLKLSVVSLMCKILLIPFIYVFIYGVLTKWQIYMEIKSLILKNSAV